MIIYTSGLIQAECRQLCRMCRCISRLVRRLFRGSGGYEIRSSSRAAWNLISKCNYARMSPVCRGRCELCGLLCILGGAVHCRGALCTVYCRGYCVLGPVGGGMCVVHCMG